MLSKENKYYFYSFLNTFFNSINNILATNSSLYALSKHKQITKLYIYKDIIGQLSGLLIAYHTKNNNINKHILVKEGYKICTIQQIAIMLELTLRYNPNRYILYTGISNTLKNISWIHLGAINAQLIYNISKQSTSDGKVIKNIPDIYTNISIINTIGSSLGMYIGTKLINNTKLTIVKQLCILSPSLYLCQLYLMKKIILI